MSTCATAAALAVTNRLPFVLDDADEVVELIDGMLGHPTECGVEFYRAVDLARDAFIAAYPWMGLAVFPPEWKYRTGAPTAWVAHYEAKHGMTVERPVLDSSRFEPCDHLGPRPTVVVQTPDGRLIPLDELPEDVQRDLRERMGLDDDD
jgi:hypothetical protein